jgi:hypothetical protein
MKRMIDTELDELCAAVDDHTPASLRSTLDMTVRMVDCGHRVERTPSLGELDGEDDE